MSRGVLLFAFNNQNIDYVRLAKHCAHRIKIYLDVPVTLVTDQVIQNDDIFDNVIIQNLSSNHYRTFSDGIETSFVDIWNNLQRLTCYDITPYEETLVLDCDYILNSNFLNCCWNNVSDFLLFKDSCDLSNQRVIKEFSLISDTSIEFCWATVFYFRKTDKNDLFFRLIEHIRENWSYYMTVYHTLSSNFRNDIAFSIALHMFNGFSKKESSVFFPGKMFYTLDKDHLLDCKDSAMNFLIENIDQTNSYIPAKIESVDVHIMNKKSILRFLDQKGLYV